MAAAVKNQAGLTGHPAHLKDGTWGAHVDSQDVHPGDVVHIETKSGKTWDDVVGRVIWTGTDSDGKPCALATVKTRGKGADTAKPEASAATGAALPAFEDDDLPDL